MGSKAFVFLGLFLAVALLISSEVTARDLAETTTSTTPTTVDQQTNGIDDAKHYCGGDGDGYYGCHYCYRHCGCYYGGDGGYGGGYGRGGYNKEGN